MGKPCTWDFITTETMEVEIPVTKRHKIKLNLKDRWIDGNAGIYPPSLEIFCGVNMVTDLYIKRNANQVIAPTADNIKTAIELIEEAEYRMKERRQDANESITDES